MKCFKIILFFFSIKCEKKSIQNISFFLFFSKTSSSATNLGALDNMMPRNNSRGSTPPTPGNELEEDENVQKKMANMVTTTPAPKEKKKLIFKKVFFFN